MASVNAATGPARTVLFSPEEWARHLAQDTRAGLLADPPSTPPVWFYDKVGSRLFDVITELPEYYLTRAEREILQARAAEIAGLSGARSLVELGAGSAAKTHLLLSALARAGSLRRYVPVDCSQSSLEAALVRVRDEFPGLEVHQVVADFTAHLPHLPRGPKRMIAFLGSTLGNLNDATRSSFLAELATHVHAGDTVLLGTDLIKGPDRMLAAYDDSAGVTAEFNLNALSVMNRELDADFRLSAYRHQAVFNAAKGRIEMRVVARSRQVVTFGGLGNLRLILDAGQWLRTEISVKFTPSQVRSELRAVGLRTVAQWTDPAGDFLVTLAGSADKTPVSPYTPRHQPRKK